MSLIHYTFCPACGSDELKPVLNAVDHTVSHEQFAIWQCQRCSLRFTQDAPEKEFFAYLAAQGRMLDFEAIKWYNEFSFDLRNRIRNEDEVSWEGIGVLKKDGSGNILLESATAPAFFLQPVPAMKVKHQDAVHTLLVGDRERTSGEMNEWLYEEAASRKRLSWWVIALALLVIGLAILAWHFYTHGFSTANQSTI